MGRLSARLSFLEYEVDAESTQKAERAKIDALLGPRR